MKQFDSCLVVVVFIRKVVIFLNMFHDKYNTKNLLNKSICTKYDRGFNRYFSAKTESTWNTPYLIYVLIINYFCIIKSFA